MRVLRNVLISMDDGVNLAADVYAPDSDGKFPAILEYIPYRKDDYTFSGTPPITTLPNMDSQESDWTYEVPEHQRVELTTNTP